MNNATPAATKPPFELRSKVWKLPPIASLFNSSIINEKKANFGFFLKKSGTYFTIKTAFEG